MSDRWSPEKRHAFDLMGPQALCVIMPDKAASVTLYDADGSVFKRIGGNQASWAVKIGLSRQKKDTVSLPYKNPWVAMRMRCRLWCARLEEAQELDRWAHMYLEQAAEQAGLQQLINGFINVGPKFNPEKFQRDVQIIAKRRQIMCWDEGGLSTFLDRTLQFARRNGIRIVDGRGRKTMITALRFQRICHHLVEEERKKQFPPVLVAAKERVT